jgi:hypothetical protein
LEHWDFERTLITIFFCLARAEASLLAESGGAPLRASVQKRKTTPSFRAIMLAI